jgi:hypothetical protein
MSHETEKKSHPIKPSEQTKKKHQTKQQSRRDRMEWQGDYYFLGACLSEEIMPLNVVCLIAD